MTYTSGLWKAWATIRPNLVLHPVNSELPARWRTEDTLTSMQDFCRLSTTGKATVLATVACLGIKTLKDLLALQSQEPQIWDQRILRVRGTLQEHMDLNYLVMHGLDIQRWNETWARNDSEATWQARWAKIWSSDLANQAKIFLWRILAKGLYTGARAVLMGHTEVNCKLCNTTLETIPHIF
jgi:hypothetical protein